MLKDGFTNAAEVKNAVPVKNESNVKRGRAKKAPIWKVLDASRKKFDAQLTKNVEVKRACIKFCIAEHYADQLRFWLDFKGQTERLLDSKSFDKYCTERKLKPEIVAEHVVYESETVMKRVLSEGIDSVIGERVMMFTQPLFVDENQLYSAN